MALGVEKGNSQLIISCRRRAVTEWLVPLTLAVTMPVISSMHMYLFESALLSITIPGPYDSASITAEKQIKFH